MRYPEIKGTSNYGPILHAESQHLQGQTPLLIVEIDPIRIPRSQGDDERTSRTKYGYDVIRSLAKQTHADLNRFTGVDGPDFDLVVTLPGEKKGNYRMVIGLSSDDHVGQHDNATADAMAKHLATYLNHKVHKAARQAQATQGH